MRAGWVNIPGVDGHLDDGNRRWVPDFDGDEDASKVPLFEDLEDEPLFDEYDYEDYEYGDGEGEE